MELNSKLNYKNSLKAIDIKDKLNDNKGKEYSFINKDEVSYFVLNKDNELNGYEFYNAILNNFKSMKKEISVDLDSFVALIKKDEIEKMIISLVSALEYVSITPWTMATTKVEKCKFNLIGKSVDSHKAIIEEYIVLSESQSFTRKLQDMPSNYLYPGSFVDEITKRFKGLSKVKISILDTKELKAKGMDLLTGVGKAIEGEKSPKMLVLEYKNNKASDKLFGYVGKGVCFDAGGYNVKTGPNMRWMKFDMSGAAIVTGALYALAKNNIETNVVVVTPMVMNLINENAQLPDDVLKSYSGKTVEIDNTDAEGRLILADALTYAAKDLKATHLFDVATLTGAMVYSLGDTYSGVWTTTDCLWRKVEDAANYASEQVWRLPFNNEFTEMLKSKVADIVNSCNGPKAGSSRAACFLREFTMGLPYAHFDVAATADKNNEGTGIILRTLYTIAKTQKNKCCE